MKYFAAVLVCFLELTDIAHLYRGFLSNFNMQFSTGCTTMTSFKDKNIFFKNWN